MDPALALSPLALLRHVGRLLGCRQQQLRIWRAGLLGRHEQPFCRIRKASPLAWGSGQLICLLCKGEDVEWSTFAICALARSCHGVLGDDEGLRECLSCRR